MLAHAFNGKQKPGRFVAGRLLFVDDRAHAFNGEQKPKSFGVRLLLSVGNRAHAFNGKHHLTLGSHARRRRRSAGVQGLRLHRQ